MKIIFLDIDGVLNPTHFNNALFKMWKASHEEIKSKDEFGDLFFDQNVDALRFIIEHTESQIVLSSTWRMNGLNRNQQMWLERDLPGKLIDITPHANELLDDSISRFYDDICRGAEIDYWIKDKNFTGNYIIIDDTEDMLKSQESVFIKTNPYCGLTMKDAKRAIEILNK